MIGKIYWLNKIKASACCGLMYRVSEKKKKKYIQAVCQMIGRNGKWNGLYNEILWNETNKCLRDVLLTLIRCEIPDLLKMLCWSAQNRAFMKRGWDATHPNTQECRNNSSSTAPQRRNIVATSIRRCCYVAVYWDYEILGYRTKGEHKLCNGGFNVTDAVNPS